MTLAGTANATGINLFWDDCATGGGVTNKMFACNTNVGHQDLYISVDPPYGVESTNGHNQIIDLQSQHSPLPAWWDFKYAGTCRQTALLASGDFTTGRSAGAGCVDPWQGQGQGAVAAYTTNFFGVACLARIIGSIPAPGNVGVPMTNGTEYYSIKLRITNAKTVGDGACGGCPEPVCLVLNTVRIAQPAPLPTFNIYDPRDSNYASWQTPWVCGGVCCIAIETGEVSNPQLPDCIPTPVEPRTWGLLKSLYR